MYLYICQQIEFKMNKYRITNPNNKEVRECKSRTTGYDIKNNKKGTEKTNKGQTNDKQLLKHT